MDFEFSTTSYNSLKLNTFLYKVILSNIVGGAFSNTLKFLGVAPTS